MQEKSERLVEQSRKRSERSIIDERAKDGQYWMEGISAFDGAFMRVVFAAQVGVTVAER